MSDQPNQTDFVELEVGGIRVMGDEDSPVLILEHQESSTVLPIWIGNVEAAAITLQLSKEEEFARPLTHDLLGNIIAVFAEQPGEIWITAMEDGVYFAALRIGDAEFDCRPSDAVAVAIQLSWPIRCPVELLSRIGVANDELDRNEVDEFVAFLDHISAADFTDDGETS